MATTQQMQDRIASFTRELIEDFGEVDASNAISWLDAFETLAAGWGDAGAA